MYRFSSNKQFCKGRIGIFILLLELEVKFIKPKIDSKMTNSCYPFSILLINKLQIDWICSYFNNYAFIFLQSIEKNLPGPFLSNLNAYNITSIIFGWWKRDTSSEAISLKNLPHFTNEAYYFIFNNKILNSTIISFQCFATYSLNNFLFTVSSYFLAFCSPSPCNCLAFWIYSRLTPILLAYASSWVDSRSITIR